MKTIPLRDAKATFSAIVESAEHGEPTIVTKHGRPAVMIVPFAKGQRLYAEERPGFAELLLALPHELDIDRDPTPVREIDL